MILILLIGLVLVGVAFGLFARTLLFPRLKAAEGLRQIDSYGFDARATSAPAEKTTRQLPRVNVRESVDALATRVGGMLASRSGSEEALKRELLSAGFYTTSPRRFVGYQVLGTLGLGALFLWFALSGSGGALLSILLVVIGLASGWMLPLVYVRRRARKRAERIDYDMPELIDSLVAVVEAGIAFGSALQISSRRFRGPLGEELRLALQEQSMGLGLHDALANMLERQNTKSTRAFVRSLVQGEQLGVSVGQTLRNLSHDMRTLRRQLAEERAQKAPVKLVFPVVLLIFPALLVVTLGPAALELHHIFS